MTDVIELRPARPDAGGGSPSYMPRLPWKWILGLGSLLAVSTGTCQWREHQEVEALRLSVKQAYEAELGPVAKRYDSLATQLRQHTLAALEKPAERYTDPRLKLDMLGSGQGLYLRIRPPGEDPPESVFAAALALPQDAIARCLGAAPGPAAEFISRGSFLDPSFIAQADKADSVMKLRVVAEEMRQRSLRDLPFLVERLKAKWFLLAIERGEGGRGVPLDMYLWDLQDDTLLLSARVQAEGALVAARIAVNGVTPKQYGDGAQSSAAQDCAMASALRALTGGGAAEFAAPPPAPLQALNSAVARSAEPGAPKTARMPSPNGTPTP